MILIESITIRNREIRKLLEFIDDQTLIKKFDSKAKQIKYGTFFGVPLRIIEQAILIILVLDVGYNIISIQYFILLVIIAGLLNGGNSVIQNRWVFYNSEFITQGILLKVSSKISNLLNYKQKVDLNNLVSTISGYHLMYNNLITYTGLLSLIILGMVLSKTDLYIKLGTLIITIIFFTSLLIAGKEWVKTYGKIREYNLNTRRPPKNMLRYRVSLPILKNNLVDYSLPVALVILGKIHSNTILPQVSLLISVTEYTWTLISNTEKAKTAKKSLYNINKTLAKIENRYVVNKKSFKDLCKNCKPGEDLLGVSKINKSLVLKNFVPKSFINSKNTKRKFSFEFLPGIYQINGLNGVGKTTLVQSLTLPKDTVTEKSRGEVAYKGEEFLDCTKPLKYHRDRFHYVGAGSKQVNVSNIQIQKYKKYPKLHKLLKQIVSEKKTKYSEGEKGIIEICNFYQSAISKNFSKIVVIDEIISRIHQSIKNPLRDEMLALIKEAVTKNNEIIVIIIDHVSCVEEAKQLTLRHNKILVETSIP